MSGQSVLEKRARLVQRLVYLGFLVVASRLFYWQVAKAAELQLAVDRQSTNLVTIQGSRGLIYTSDNHLLVGNQPAFDLYVNRSELTIPEKDVVEKLIRQYVQLLATDLTQESSFTRLFFETQIPQLEKSLVTSFEKSPNWLLLISDVPTLYKESVLKMRIAGLHFIESETRVYPEASMAAHLTGFVGKDSDGNRKGYFGIEGALEKELAGDTKQVRYRQDASGSFLADQKMDFKNLNGRDITLTIRRDIQHIAQEALNKGIERSISQAGEVVIIDPKTGALLALATWPQYNQAHFLEYSTQEYKNPSITSLYEPGSTFKVLTLATGVELGLVNSQTECTMCAGPRVIAGHTINTWNKQFHANITMIEALRQSDNTAMVFVAEQIGADRLLESLKKFGIGESMQIELQEDTSSPLPIKIGPVELATISFGQGILTNSFQMARAVGAIANDGVMMKTRVVQSVYDPQTQQQHQRPPETMRRVISSETAHEMVQMMVHSASKRQNWLTKNYLVAGKSGTSQIPSPDGGYKEQGTIASYIGFAPADDPKFVMLVKLTEPKLDSWGETTAVPIWYEIAEKIILLL